MIDKFTDPKIRALVIELLWIGVLDEIDAVLA